MRRKSIGIAGALTLALVGSGLAYAADLEISAEADAPEVGSTTTMQIYMVATFRGAPVSGVRWNLTEWSRLRSQCILAITDFDSSAAVNEGFGLGGGFYLGLARPGGSSFCTSRNWGRGKNVLQVDASYTLNAVTYRASKVLEAQSLDPLLTGTTGGTTGAF